MSENLSNLNQNSQYGGINHNSKHGGNIWETASDLKISPDKIIDFSSNINPLGLTKNTLKIIRKNLNYITKYPDPDSKELRIKLSRILNITLNITPDNLSANSNNLLVNQDNLLISPDNLLVGNGSSELFYTALKAINPKNVIIPAPSFIEYEKAAKSVGAKCFFINYKIENNNFNFNDFKLDFNELIDLIDSIIKIKNPLMQPSVIFLANPNNPTGSIIDREQILLLINKCKENGFFIFIDEAFIDFLDTPYNYSLINKVNQFENLVVFRSLTKFFAIPGLRLGYLAANKSLINKIRAYQSDWPVNLIAQVVGKEIINDNDYIIKTRKFIKKERYFLFKSLEKINQLKLYNSLTNFILIEIKNDENNIKKLDSRALYNILLTKYKILIRDCSNFRNLGDNFFRIAVKKRKDNEYLVGCLNKVLN